MLILDRKEHFRKNAPKINNPGGPFFRKNPKSREKMVFWDLTLLRCTSSEMFFQIWKQHKILGFKRSILTHLKINFALRRNVFTFFTWKHKISITKAEKKTKNIFGNLVLGSRSLSKNSWRNIHSHRYGCTQPGLLNLRDLPP